jgi:type IV pilus assembly protein PilO
MSVKISELDIKEAHIWPIPFKMVLLSILFIVPLIIGWFVYFSDKNDSWTLQQQEEVTLKKTFQDKYAQVQSLEELKVHKQIVAEQVKSLEGLLPSRTEMDKLLSDINQAGTSRNLNFELFEPKEAVIQQYYAKIPVNISLKGTYHDIANFMADLAALSRIVNVDTLKIVNEAKKNPDQVSLIGTINTYRLLDEQEKSAQKKRVEKETPVVN